MPKTAIGAISAARPQPIFAVDPVVASTNQGRATIVMFVPVSETKRDPTTARSVRSRSTSR
jgi:hypothetical protein